MLWLLLPVPSSSQQMLLRRGLALEYATLRWTVAGVAITSIAASQQGRARGDDVRAGPLEAGYAPIAGQQ